MLHRAGLIDFNIPFRSKKLLHLILLMMLAGSVFLIATAAYVTTHKPKQPPARSPHGHANRTPGDHIDPGTSPAR